MKQFGVVLFIVVNALSSVSATLAGSNTLLTLIVGPHKTGSSTVEELLYALNSPLAKLLQEDNFGIPVFHKGLNFNRQKNADVLAKNFMSGNVNSSSVMELENALSKRGHTQVVVAAENLCLDWNEPGLALLKTVLPMLRVVVSMRDVPDWIRSGYHQWKNNHTFSEWVEYRKYEPYAVINPHSVSRKFAEFGVSVVHYNFMDMTALFCAVLNSPKACRYARSSTMRIPHENDKSSHVSVECAPAEDVDRMEKYFTTHHSVPVGQYNWSKLYCV